jgi:crotonobetainyl-CoA:carnitine CoA-transferase CaiB-like acyl-CoA transferase
VQLVGVSLLGELGADTNEVLQEVGYSDAEITHLRKLKP